MEKGVNMENGRFKYFAFISYKSDDLPEAWSLKKKLDGYKLPALLCKQYNKDRKPTHEAFLDKTNIQPGDLTDELRENLDKSHYLIVVCSPRSAKSEYVTDEIEWFTRNGRENEMFLYIIESDPKNIESSFNPAIKEAEKRWSERDGEKREILGVNIKEKDVDKLFFLYRWPIIGPWLQRERAYMQLISRLLDLEFEQLWSYQRIRLVEKIIAWVAGVILGLSALSYTAYINKSVDITAGLKEVSIQNEQLPPLKDAVITLILGDKTEVDTVHSIDEKVLFKEIAHKHLGKEVRITVKCQNYMDIDTNFVLSKAVALNIKRNPLVYGNIHFRLWNPNIEKAITNTEVEIAGYKAVSDDEGSVVLFIPLERQRPFYLIKTNIPLDNDTIYLPCGIDDVVLTK